MVNLYSGYGLTILNQLSTILKQPVKEGVTVLKVLTVKELEVYLSNKLVSRALKVHIPNTWTSDTPVIEKQELDLIESAYGDNVNFIITAVDECLKQLNSAAYIQTYEI